MTLTATTLIGPADNGRRMRLVDFDQAEVQDGWLYELGRGVIVVSNVPNEPHGLQLDALRMLLYAWRIAHAGSIHFLAAGSDCRLVIEGFESERHPDLAVYKSPPDRRPGAPKGKDVWWHWVPDLVVEVVSPGSRDRDLEEKREEYLAFGVGEYWIVDADHREIVVLVRRNNRWVERTIKPGLTHACEVLPGLTLDPAPIFAAADAATDH